MDSGKPYFKCDDGLWECRVCNGTFKGIQIAAHYRSAHSRVKCGQCGKLISELNSTKHKCKFLTEAKCKFGCSRDAKFGLETGNPRCSSNANQCPKLREAQSKVTGGKPKFTLVQTDVVCSYGCGHLAQYQFQNGKFCCSTQPHECSKYRQNSRYRTIESISSSEAAAAKTLFLYILRKRRSQLYNSFTSEERTTYLGDRQIKWWNSLSRDQQIEHGNKISKSKRENFNGTYSQTSYGHSGYYKGIWCDSSWELAWVYFHLEQGTPFVRNRDKFKYIYDGKERNYVPDFKVFDTWTEIKAFSNTKWECKYRDFPDKDKLIVLWGDDIKHLVKDLEQKYGVKYWEVLYDKTGTSEGT